MNISNSQVKKTSKNEQQDARNVKQEKTSEIKKREFELPRKNTVMYYILEILWHLDSRKRKGVSGVLLRGIFQDLQLNFSSERLLKLINRCLKNMFSLGMVKRTTPMKFLLTKEYRKYLNSEEFYEKSSEITKILKEFNL